MSELFIISEKIKSFLGDNLILLLDVKNSSIILKPPPTTAICTGYFLEHIRHHKWKDVVIPDEITVVLEGWLIDVNDRGIGHDIWCLQWMKNNYHIVDNCIRISLNED